MPVFITAAWFTCNTFFLIKVARRLCLSLVGRRMDADKTSRSAINLYKSTQPGHPYLRISAMIIGYGKAIKRNSEFCFRQLNTVVDD